MHAQGVEICLHAKHAQVMEISGVELRDPIYWSLHVLHSAGVTVRGVRITSDWDVANTDGGWQDMLACGSEWGVLTCEVLRYCSTYHSTLRYHQTAR